MSTICFGVPKRRLARVVFLLPRTASNFSMRSEAVSRDGFLAAAPTRQRARATAASLAFGSVGGSVLGRETGAAFWGARASATSRANCRASASGGVLWRESERW